MKHPVIAMMRHRGTVELKIGGHTEILPIKLPKGCLGITFLFESKKTARAYFGKDVGCMRCKILSK